MKPQHSALSSLADRVRAAAADRTPLQIVGGGTKAFYGEAATGDVLDVRPLSGISSYEPTELVVTALAGTPLAELEATLAERGQALAFQPPRFATGGTTGETSTDATTATAAPAVIGKSGGTVGGTVGGMVAAGLAGPARVSAGSVRDHLLGATLLDGEGRLLSFGGQVMKNVAGYDVSRALAGSLGVLGVICEVSLKVMPIAPAHATLRFELDEATALQAINRWAGQPLPLHASAWWEGMLVVRLAGARAAVQSAMAQLGGDVVPDALAEPFWQGVRDQRDEFFIGAQRAVDGGATLWRLSVPGTAPPLNLSGEQLIEWHGAQRWLCTATPAAVVRAAVDAVGGHATLFMTRDRTPGVFHPLAPALERIHRELKRTLDPHRLFNPGRLYPWL